MRTCLTLAFALFFSAAHAQKKSGTKYATMQSFAAVLLNVNSSVSETTSTFSPAGLEIPIPMPGMRTTDRVTVTPLSGPSNCRYRGIKSIGKDTLTILISAPKAGAKPILPFKVSTRRK